MPKTFLMSCLALCSLLLRLSNCDPMKLGTTAAVFEDIYDSQAWGSTASSVSGPGSEPTSQAVQETRDFFEKLIRRTMMKGRKEPLVLADAGCGDLVWVGQLISDLVKRDLLSVRYQGFDIVDLEQRGAVDRLRRRLKEDDGVRSDRASVSFTQLDLTTTPLPVRATITLVKDVINHIRLNSALTALCMLANAAEPNGWLVITSNQHSKQNKEIEEEVVGYESRARNLLLPPFSFGTPMFSTEYLAVWRADHIANGPCTVYDKLDL